MIKITNIISDIADKDEFANAIKEQNAWTTKLNFAITDFYSVDTARGKYTNIIITTDLNAQKIFLQKGKILLGLNSSRIHEYVNVIQCRNCCKFGHFYHNCTNPPRCRKCGDLHLYEDCEEQESNKVCCINFVAENKTGKRYNTRHRATDNRCATRIARIEALKLLHFAKN